MSKKVDDAVAIFNNGFNCAQSVLSVFAEDFDLSHRDALRVSGAFGAGMGSMGNVCGAVTGAFMAIGLAHSKTKDGEDENKLAGYGLVNKFSDAFCAQHGSIECKALLGVDLKTQEGKSSAMEQGLFHNQCPRYVKTAVQILEQLLDQPASQ